MRSVRLATLAVGVAVTIPMAGAAFAAPASDLSKSEVKPFTFVGHSDGCEGTNIVTSKWVPHTGLADVHGNADKALYLAKQGPTADCSSAGATITKVGGLTVTELGYDLRNDSHCGAGAPRFNVVADGTTYFFGCAAMDSSATTDPDWTHKSVNISGLGPVQSIEIVFDEGLDQGSGEAWLDNVEINGTVVGH